ncbi:hypothetical protein EH138_22895 [Salmonella enterica subsp. enterica serovar Eastbourne]|nr:hypothetical protein [Salmonella enterica subsp. enterica serovar Eastbourne]ECA1898229.1 hypothetical protein [Salmonella enterica subsp. enterica serovar Eastbourne]HAE5116277.1 hypothetical protein [Salmonella enterica subsp. enterica serovar Eastbourne]HAE8030656.1 hypothetical protein [Salmonella enterica subsp. enterica serovar Eastbourne]
MRWWKKLDFIVIDNSYHFDGSFPAVLAVTGRQRREISLLMKIFSDPFPVPDEVNILICISSPSKKTGNVHVLSN